MTDDHIHLLRNYASNVTYNNKPVFIQLEEGPAMDLTPKKVRKMEAPEYYNITKRTQYVMEFEACTDLLELSDSFITKEDLTVLQRGNNCQGGHNKIFFATAIRETLLDWISLIKPGCASTRVTNPEIRTLLSEVHVSLLWRCAPDGYEVTGKTIRNSTMYNAQYQNTTWKPRGRADHVIQRDLKNLNYAITFAINTKYRLQLPLRKYPTDAKANLEVGKKLVGLRDIISAMKSMKWYSIDKADQKWVITLWKDPQLVHNFLYHPSTTTETTS